MFIKKKDNRGFTMVEIMIAVAVIGILAAIATPNFVKARDTARKNACIADLKQILNAKQLWALDTGRVGTATPSMLGDDGLVPNYIKNEPKCPAGGNYTIGIVNSDPACTVAGHTLVLVSGAGDNTLNPPPAGRRVPRPSHAQP